MTAYRDPDTLTRASRSILEALASKVKEYALVNSEIAPLEWFMAIFSFAISIAKNQPVPISEEEFCELVRIAYRRGLQ